MVCYRSWKVLFALSTPCRNYPALVSAVLNRFTTRYTDGSAKSTSQHPVGTADQCAMSSPKILTPTLQSQQVIHVLARSMGQLSVGGAGLCAMTSSSSPKSFASSADLKWSRSSSSSAPNTNNPVSILGLRRGRSLHMELPRTQNKQEMQSKHVVLQKLQYFPGHETMSHVRIHSCCQ